MSNILEIKDLFVEVDGKVILRNINLEIPKGEVHLLIGPNGSGKTSLLMTIMGYPQYKVTKGSILFDGKNLLKLNITERAALGIGIAEQRPPTISGVKLKMLLSYLLDKNPKWKEEIDKEIENSKMKSFLNRDINGGLSGGEIKKSELLLLLSRQPIFTMLDEPDSGVDIDSLELLRSMINKLFSPEEEHPVKRRSGLIITHSEGIIESIHADKTHIIINGEIVCDGNPQLVMKQVVTSGFESCIKCNNLQGSV